MAETTDVQWENDDNVALAAGGGNLNLEAGPDTTLPQHRGFPLTRFRAYPLPLNTIRAFPGE